MRTTATPSTPCLDDRQDRRRGRIVKSELNGRNCLYGIHNRIVNRHGEPQDAGDECDMQTNRENSGGAGAAVNALIEAEEHCIAARHKRGTTARGKWLSHDLRLRESGVADFQGLQGSG